VFELASSLGDTYEWWFSRLAGFAGLDAIFCINNLNQTAVDAIRGVNKGYNSERIIGGQAMMLLSMAVRSLLRFTE
jgi:hypothetical protein